MGTKEQDLKDFHDWLLRYGRAENTAEMYCYHIARAWREGGILARIVDRDLAPKTRHAIMAAGRQYSKFKEDADLLTKLEQVRLPPAKRQVNKEPLEEEEWFTLCDYIDNTSDLKDPMRALLGIMATRGFRVGDVLRFRRKEICKSLKTGVLSFEGKLGKRHEYSVLPGFEHYLVIFSEYTGYKQVCDLIAPKCRRPQRAAYDRAYRQLSKCSKKAGITHITPHILRHTYARHFLRQLGGDPEAVTKLQAHMEWSKIDTAAQYVGYHKREVLDGIATDLMRRRKQ